MSYMCIHVTTRCGCGFLSSLTIATNVRAPTYTSRTVRAPDGTSGEHGNTSGGSAHGAAPLRNSDSTASALTSLRRSIEDLKSKRKQNTQNLLDLKSNIKELRKDTDKLLKFQTKSMIAKM